MSNNFVLVVNASNVFAFDANEFCRTCPPARPVVYVAVDLEVDGGDDVLSFFRVGGALEPRTTFLFAEEGNIPSETAAGGAGSGSDGGGSGGGFGPFSPARQVAEKLGLSFIGIPRPDNGVEFCGALTDYKLVWAKKNWRPPGFFLHPNHQEFHANTTGFFDGNGVQINGPTPNNFSIDDVRYGAYSITSNGSQVGNLVVIPQSYAPTLSGVLQVNTDNFWLPAQMPGTFFISPVMSHSHVPQGSVRRSYSAITFSNASLINEPTNSSNVWRLEFVASTQDGTQPTIGYLRAEPTPTAWRWYASPSAVSSGFFDFPATKNMMRLTRVTSGLTSQMLAGMHIAVTPSVS